MALLNEPWVLVDQRKNHLLPMVNASGYGTARSGRRKRTHNAPRTAYQRIIELKAMDERHTAELAAREYSLNPALTRRIAEIQWQLIARSKFRSNGTSSEFGEQFS